MSGKVNYAVLAGFCASAASLFGKLSGLPTFEGYFIVRILFFALMVACNAGVWTLFVKALQNVESSLTATVTSAASNYCLSVRAPNRDYFQLNLIFRRLQVFLFLEKSPL
jgi:uncharacterized membrane protein